MLNRFLGALIVVTAFLGLSVSPAAADDGGVTCPPNQPICIVVVHDPGGPGGGGQPGGSTPGQPVCKVAGTGEVVPCYDPTWGWWSNTDSCYYQRLAPQPPATSPEWQGHYPNGAIYASTCIGGAGGTGGGWVWFNTAPQGYGGAAPTPAQLAQQAVDTMRLDGPNIGMAPPVGKTGLVGLPVWMWTTVSAATWGPTSATASVPGLTVTATARAKRIVWDMGDGHSVTCNNPGTPYSVDKGTRSPTCGYVYTDSSAPQPNHAFMVTATTTWDVAWSGGGQTGVITVTRSSTAAVRIGEMQVLVS